MNKKSNQVPGFQPDYYKEFHCIADQCSFTCCREWNIAVDQDTYQSWKGVSFEGRQLDSFTKKKDGARAIQLNQEHLCPFLSKDKLCNLVIQNGDEILSDTCTTFPRQIHEFRDRMEASLVSCCPEVVDILRRQERISIEEISVEGDVKGRSAAGNQGNSDKASLLEIRSMLMDVIQNPVLDPEMELMILFEIMLGIFENRGATRQDLAMCRSKEYLERMAADIRTLDFDPLETFCENNELYLDLVENYRKEGLYTIHLKESVALAEELEKRSGQSEEEAFDEEKEEAATANRMDESDLMRELEVFRIQFQEYEKLFRNYLASEFFTNLLIPDCSLESMVVMLQWITLQYVTIRHAIFLQWKQRGSGELVYTEIRDCIVLLSRMTGYDLKDIYEYLDHSFQSRIWEWGYDALIVGLS